MEQAKSACGRPKRLQRGDHLRVALQCVNAEGQMLCTPPWFGCVLHARNISKDSWSLAVQSTEQRVGGR